MNQEEEAPDIFTGRHHLELQQLLTRQALSGQKKPVQDGNEVEGNIDDNSSNQDDLGFDTKWRLIPKELKLHDWQVSCREEWLKRGHGTVKVATGGGKTIFALAVAEALQNSQEIDLRLVVVVPTIPLMRQWLDELSDTNIPRHKIALMGGGESTPDDPDLRILICVLNSARDRLPAMVERFEWSSKLLLVVDECHRANASEARKILGAAAAYTLGLSATPETEQGDPNIPSDEAYALSDVGMGLGPIIYEFSLKQSLAAGLLTAFEVWHVGLSLNSDEVIDYVQLSREIAELRKDLQIAHRHSKGRAQPFLAWCQTQAKKSGGADAARFMGIANERKRLVYRASARSNFTLKILAAAAGEEDRRAIVFHESVEEVNRLFIRAVELGFSAVLEHGSLPPHLRNGNIELFRRGLAKTIISVKSLVEGFNVPSADVGIIAASSGSVRQRIQSLGRMLRKKASDDAAVIFVLYVKDTEDEAIYQRADWESVIGADRNRYFEWSQDAEGDRTASDLSELQAQLDVIGGPPRQYRPPCNEVSFEALEIGSEYPGQTTGIELRVDQAGNLRTDDGILAIASKNALETIVDVNQHRRAVRTPCGHLICRSGTKRGAEDVWFYLGIIEEPVSEPEGAIEKLMVKSVAGRRVIAKKSGRNEVFARGPDKASSVSAGETQNLLLEWIKKQEEQRSNSIRELYWDMGVEYWIEVDGARLIFEGATDKLEFPQ
jgi:superfamily II DNA or RNA helicase